VLVDYNFKEYFPEELEALKTQRNFFCKKNNILSSGLSQMENLILPKEYFINCEGALFSTLIYHFIQKKICMF
jgi:hypothetical protein